MFKNLLTSVQKRVIIIYVNNSLYFKNNFFRSENSMLFIYQDFEDVYQPETVVLADVSKKRIIKNFLLKKGEIFYKKVKRFFPYGKNGFTTETSIVVSMEEAIYQLEGKCFKFFDNRFTECKLGKIVAKKEIATEKFCHYKMFLVTFYDIVTQILTTKYLVVPR